MHTCCLSWAWSGATTSAFVKCINLQTYQVLMNSMHLRYAYIELKDRRFGSCLTNDSHHCVALVEWKFHLFGTLPTPLSEPHHPNKHFRPARIDYFAWVSVLHKSDSHNLIVASLLWHVPHPAHGRLGPPAELWSNSLFEISGVYSFVPLDCLVARCAYCTKLIDGENVLVVVPEVH